MPEADAEKGHRRSEHADRFSADSEVRWILWISRARRDDHAIRAKAHELGNGDCVVPDHNKAVRWLHTDHIGSRRHHFPFDKTRKLYRIVGTVNAQSFFGCCGCGDRRVHDRIRDALTIIICKFVKVDFLTIAGLRRLKLSIFFLPVLRLFIAARDVERR